jgi:hypothetical protein
MTVNYIKKVWKKADKTIPGISDFIDDPLTALGVSKKAKKTLNLLAGLYLAHEKEKKIKSGARMQFSKRIKLAVLKAQKNKCKKCKCKLEEVDFDHIDGNRANNSISNCQALCLDCHRKKNRNHKK